MKQSALYIYIRLIILAFRSRKIKDINKAKNRFGESDISFFENESKEEINSKIKGRNLNPDIFSISDVKNADLDVTAIHLWFLSTNGFVLEVKEYRDFKIGKHFGYTDKLYKREQGA